VGPVSATKWTSEVVRHAVWAQAATDPELVRDAARRLPEAVRLQLHPAEAARHLVAIINQEN
jgi:hypothetical protein